MVHWWMYLLAALLPVAAASGWYMARRTPSPRGMREADGIRSDYFRGINYLLNEQPDKAIEVFIRVLEVDSETVETHLALGNLYRRRGEVDRAIRIHQNLIARPTLDVRQRNEALLELAQDYMSAGLLDRAENLFQELCETESFRTQALSQMLDIYEQESDWDKAIDTARKLGKVIGQDQAGVIAHYHCEKAELASRHGDISTAMAAIRLATDIDPDCVRASLLQARMHVDSGSYADALTAFRCVENQDTNFLPEIIEELSECYRQLDKTVELEPYLQRLTEEHDVVSATLNLAELKRDKEGAAAAARFVGEELRARPSVRGLDYVLRLVLQSSDPVRIELETIQALTEKLIEHRVEYKCGHCGFPAKSLHWKCPACKHWSTIKPMQGVAGER